jgi:DNA-nicking Smr family endonuclease
LDQRKPALPLKTVIKGTKAHKSAPPFPTTPTLRPFKVGEKSTEKKVNQPPAFHEKQKVTSPNMDRRNFQRLVKGQKEIDGTLDLHGLTADQAKARLIAYVTQSHAMGLRLIVVITGKGKHKGFDEFNRPIVGVLRQNLPEWLRGAAIADKILQVSQAQPRHGGAGAFYVYLRRKRQ